MDKREFVTNFLPAAVSGLSDGDTLGAHEPYTDRQQVKLYGEYSYTDGKVARAIARAAIDNGTKPGRIYDFQGFTAGYFVAHDNQPKPQRAKNAIRIYPEVVTIDNDLLALARPPSLVLDLGACLASRSYLGDQLAFVDKGNNPFTYSPIVRLPFTNKVLKSTYNAYYGRGTSNTFITGKLYIGKVGSVTTATNEIIKYRRSRNEAADVADVILCTGARHTTSEDIKMGITNAYELLKENGMLIVRSLARPASDELGTRQLTDWAFAAGFPEKLAIAYQPILRKLGTLPVAGHFGTREVSTVVLAK